MQSLTEEFFSFQFNKQKT